MREKRRGIVISTIKLLYMYSFGLDARISRHSLEGAFDLSPPGISNKLLKHET